MYKKPNEFLYDHVFVNTLILSLSNVSSSSPELVYGCLIYVVLCFIQFPNNAMDGEISLAGSVDIPFYTIAVIYLELCVVLYIEQFNLSKTSNISTTRMNKFLIVFFSFLILDEIYTRIYPHHFKYKNWWLCPCSHWFKYIFKSRVFLKIP